MDAGLPAVKRYLLDVQEAKKAGADVTSLRLLKVVLVGSASAGKIRWVSLRNNGTLACTGTSLYTILFCEQSSRARLADCSRSLCLGVFAVSKSRPADQAHATTAVDSDICSRHTPRMPRPFIVHACRNYFYTTKFSFPFFSLLKVPYLNCVAMLNDGSLMQSIIAGRGSPTKGIPA